MRGVKHTRKEILVAVKKAFKKRVDLRDHAVQQNKQYRWFYRSREYYWKSWKALLSEAGIEYAELQRRAKEPARRQFLSDLHSAYEKGTDLSSSVLQQRKTKYSSLYDRSKRFYKGRFFWENALKDAGLPVDKIVRQRRWDKNKVKKRLLGRKSEEKPLNVTAIIDDEPDLYKAMIHHFDSLTNDAYRYAGINPDKVRKQRLPYSPAEIIAEVVSLWQRKKSLNRTRLLRSGSRKTRRIVMAADHMYDHGWEEAVKTAGFDYSPHKQRFRGWNKDEVIRQAKELRNKGEPLNGGYISENYRKLYKAGVRYLGSWEQTISECGFDEKDVCKPLPVGRKIIGPKKRRAEKSPLENPALMSELYKSNLELISDVASKAYSETVSTGKCSKPLADLREKAFHYLVELLPQKPPEKTIRQFCYGKIYWKLLEDIYLDDLPKI